MAASKGKGSTAKAKGGKPAKAAAKTARTAKAARTPATAAKAAKPEPGTTAKPEVVAMPARLSVAAALLRRNARRIGV